MRVNEALTRSPTAKLIFGLRVIVQHRKLPRRFGHAEYSSEPERFMSKISLDRDEFLEWDGWDRSTRSFLAAGEDPIPLDELVTEYRDAVAGFHNSLHVSIVKRNACCLEEFEHLKRELADVWGPPLDDPAAS